VITKETDYALRLLRVLADGERHTAADLAEGELVPQPFAYKILKKLARAGLVQVTRGAEGGWQLAADLEKTTLYDLMAAMEEDRCLSACMDPAYRCAWRARHDGCSVHCRLAAIQEKLDRELKSHSLAELLLPQGQ